MRKSLQAEIRLKADGSSETGRQVRLPALSPRCESGAQINVLTQRSPLLQSTDLHS